MICLQSISLRCQTNRIQKASTIFEAVLAVEVAIVAVLTVVVMVVPVVVPVVAVALVVVPVTSLISNFRSGKKTQTYS